MRRSSSGGALVVAVLVATSALALAGDPSSARAGHSSLVARTTSAGSITKVSTPAGGGQTTNDVFATEISQDGRTVAFNSPSGGGGLVTPSGTHANFWHSGDGSFGRAESGYVDYQEDNHQFERRGYAPVPSADGHLFAVTTYVAHVEDEIDDYYGYYYDEQTGAVRPVSEQPGSSDGVRLNSPRMSISASGRLVAYTSSSLTVVPGGGINGSDAYVWDAATGRTVEVSRRPDGEQADGSAFDVALAGAGRFVAFTSTSTDLVPGDTNGARDLFERDRRRHTVRQVTTPFPGAPDDTVNNCCGLHLAGVTFKGRYVVYSSDRSDLVPGDDNGSYDVFVWDRSTGTNTLVSRSQTGAPAGQSHACDVNASGGRFVLFESDAPDVVPGDDNGTSDVFRFDRTSGEVQVVSRAADGSPANRSSYCGSISGRGSSVSFSSVASDLVAGDTNNHSDVFLWKAP